MSWSPTRRSTGGNPLATLAALVCALAAVGCDRGGSPLGPDFGSEESPAAQRVPAVETEVSAETDAAAEGGVDAAETPADSQFEEVEDTESTPLRGPTSIGTYDRTIPPLIVIDGVALPIGTPLTTLEIDELDIDHVEIVKGRAARLLYGPDGAGGVIEIRTTRGSGGGT